MLRISSKRFKGVALVAALLTVMPSLIASAADDPTWTAPDVWARPYIGSGFAMRAESDDRGDTFVLWSTCCAQQGLYVSRYVAGFGWESPRQFAAHAEVRGVGFDVNGNGEAILVWADASPWVLRALRYAPGAGWRELAEIERGEGQNGPGLAAAALDENGTAYVAWVHSEFVGNRLQLPNFDFEVRAARSLGEGWQHGGRLDLSPADDNLYNLAVAASPGGGAVAVWTAMRNETALGVFASVALPSGGWGNTAMVSGPETRFTLRTVVGADRQGHYFAAWASMEPNQTDIAVVRGSAEGWEAPRVVGLNANPYGYWDEPSVAVSDAGEAVVAWSQVPPNGTMRYVTYAPEANWSAPRSFGPETGSSRGPQVIGGGNAPFAIGWTTSPDPLFNEVDLWWAPIHVTNGIGLPVRIAERRFVNEPAFAEDRFGNSIVVWGVFPQVAGQGEFFAAYRTVVPLEGIRSPALENPVYGIVAVAAAATGGALFVVWRKRKRETRTEGASEPELPGTPR